MWAQVHPPELARKCQPRCIRPSPFQRDVGGSSLLNRGMGEVDTRGGTQGMGGPASASRKRTTMNIVVRFLIFFCSFHRTDRPSTQRQQTRATTFVVVHFGHTILIPSHRPPHSLHRRISYAYPRPRPTTFEPTWHPPPALPPPQLCHGPTTTPRTLDDIEMGSTMAKQVGQHRDGNDSQADSTTAREVRINHTHNH